MSRIVSKRELSLWMIVWIAAVTFAVALGLIMSQTPAHASTVKHVAAVAPVQKSKADSYASHSAHQQKTAYKRVIEKREVWSSIRNYAAPNLVGFGTHIESYTVTTQFDYQFWPDGNDVNKVAVVRGKTCYHRNSGQGVLFQGAASNPYFMDDNNVRNPGQSDVPEDGADNCGGWWDITGPNRVWFKMSESPGWFATGKLRIQYTPDDNFNFKWGGEEFRYFHPGEDPEVSDWYYCLCDYGASPGS